MHKRASTASTSVIDVPQVRYTWDESELGVEVTATSFPHYLQLAFQAYFYNQGGGSSYIKHSKPVFIRAKNSGERFPNILALHTAG